MRLINQSLALCMILGWTLFVCADRAIAGEYKQIKAISLPGEGGWGCLIVDSEGRRLYLSHNNSLQVLDADSHKLLGTVEDVPRPQGILFLPELNRGFVTSGQRGTVVIFDLTTFKRIAELPSGDDPESVIYDKKTRKVFTFNENSKNSTVIDPVTNKVVGTIDLGAMPQISAADDDGHVFANVNEGFVLKIDAKTEKVVQRWSLAPGTTPKGIAIDKKNNRLFIGCRNQLLVIMDATDGHVIQTLPIGDHNYSTIFDPNTGAILDSEDGMLTVVRQDASGKYRVVESVATPGVHQMALDEKTGHLFLPTAEFSPDEAPASENHTPRPKVKPGTFRVLVLGEDKPATK
jgi:DNA-binding beta-propeller fold protein YncE